MLRALKPLIGYKIAATDRDAGRCTDFLFDDQAWMTRYVVINTGGWLRHQEILLSPTSVDPADDSQSRLLTVLTSQQIQDAPPLAKDKPVSQQYQMPRTVEHGLPPYLAEPSLLSAPSPPIAAQTLTTIQEEADHDPHLRSLAELCGYKLSGVAPERHGDVLGRIDDFLVAPSDWRLRYVIVETDLSWLGSHKVILETDRLDSVGWAEKRLYADMNGKRINELPSYDANHIT